MPKGDGERSLPDGGRRIPDEIKVASDTLDWGLVFNNVRFVRTCALFVPMSALGQKQTCAAHKPMSA